MAYRINYNNGVIHDLSSVTLYRAKEIADEEASYTQCSITIEDMQGNTITRRVWCPIDDGGQEDCYDPIMFGEYGYYTDWQDLL